VTGSVPAWGGLDSEIAKAVEQYSSETLAAYREAPRFVEEHANLERAAVEGGYGRRQLFELVQNGADELVDSAGRVQVVLTEDALYCANEGRPLSVAGVGALLSSHLSSKRGIEIGRFGLGFKSVLGITTRPEIFSRSGSLRFDPEEAARRIHEVVPSAQRTPVLRIALAVDAEAEATADPFLAELMTWATTVVRLPRDTADSSWLSDDLDRFPSQFLLFSPHVEQLVLDNQEKDKRRTIGAKREGDEVVLEDDGESRWRVFAVEHSPSAAAKLDAGAMADRDRIPLVWAVPTRSTGRRGEFWAFFPTLDQTTLNGVVNAPWKLNEDRTRIIEGPFNAELIERLSGLIVENLSVLCSVDDPGVLLDLMPARGREAAGWADAQLTNHVNELAKVSRSLPDQEGTLRFPRELAIHPEELPRPALALWAEQPTRPVDWVHFSVETRERRARVEMYTDRKPRASLQEWLEALRNDDNPVAGCVAALQVGSLLVRIEPKFLDHVRKAPVFLDETGAWCTADGLFVRASIPIEIDDVSYVHPEVMDAADEYLRNLEVRRVDTARLLEVKVRQGRRAWKPDDWDLFWALVRETNQTAILELLQAARVSPLGLKVRNLKGDYHAIGLLLLPGEIAHEGSVEDAKAVIDTHFHRDELATLRLLGATSGPSRNRGSRAEPWFVEYRREAETEYFEEVSKSGAAPNRDYLDFRDRSFAGPLTPLMMLSPETRARYTSAVLRVADDLDDWTFGHKTQTRYPERPWANPVLYMVRKYGVLETSLGLRRPESAVSSALEALSAVLPVARLQASVGEALELVDDPDALSEEQWDAAFTAALEVDDDATIGLLYATAAARAPAPPKLRCRVGSAHDARAADLVTVVSDPDLVVLLERTAEPFIRVETAEQQELLVERWSLRDASTAVRSEVAAVESGEAEPLADAFPMLRPRLDPNQRALLLQPCSEIRIDRFTESGRISEPQRIIVEGDTIFHLDDIEPRPLLTLVAGKVGIALTEAEVDAIFRNIAARRVKELRTAIRRAPDDASRLLLAVGADVLRARISRAVLDSVETIEGELDDVGIADLALVLHGAQVLQEYSDVLEERGLEPPQKWSGSRAAVAFARDLGFGVEFGGFESRSLERQLELEGPPEIGPLHEYQQVVVREIRDVIRGRDGLRGILSLPTGAGKTRVTIEALIDAMEDGELGSPVLWVAQTEELCEQAIETWSELWRAKGPRRRLTVSRLRASFEAEQAEHGEQVVVATVAKLDAGVFTKKSYTWLSRATCIVVDEAHTSVGPSYTRLLEWQGMPRNEDRAPLIGLTATPFRGTNEAETKRLAARYGNKRLDLDALGGEDAYPHLQEIGILSQVDHELLPGSEIRLSPDELQRLKDLRRLPEEAARRLAADTGRNRTLLESITALDDDWPVLLFCVSVEHANTMAALLTRADVPAAAISAETGKGLRRHYIDRFRRGDVRVLTNYNVLAAGFDAPRVRAVYIARPTYVPNVYQQMIGRGLRGPRNGGTDRCLLVNVADNVEQFGEQLAFHEFDYLWNGVASEAVS
jgi:superfamily II DNA or RNA helicase